MRNLFYLSVLGLFLFSSCSKDDVKTKKKVVISLNFKEFKKALSGTNSPKAKITIEKAGTSFITDKVLDAGTSGNKISLELDDNADQTEANAYKITKLELGRGNVTGSYSITDPNAKNFFAPVKNSEEATSVSVPLPITFTVNGGRITKVNNANGSSINISVITTEAATVPAEPSVSAEPGLIEKEFFLYGLKTVKEVAGNVQDAVIKVELDADGGSDSYVKVFYNDPIDRVADAAKSKYFPYIKIMDVNGAQYKFEVSKLGYKTKAVAEKTSAQLKLKKAEKVVLKAVADLTGADKNVYVKGTNVINGDALQRGGGDFGSTAYWNNLPNSATVAGTFHLGANPIESKYSLVSGNYEVVIKLYDKTGTEASADALFKVSIGSKIYWFKKGSSYTTISDLGTTQAKAKDIGTGTAGITISEAFFNGVSGKLKFEATSDAQTKVYFSIVSVTKK